MENLPDFISTSPLGLILAILVVVGGLWALWDKTIGRVLVALRLWPSMERWTAIGRPSRPDERNRSAPELDANLPIRYPGQRWCQMRNMEQGDYYQVDMQRERIISRIRLVCREGRYPEQYRIEIAGDSDIDTFKLVEDNCTGPIDYRFDRPLKFRVVKVTIVEPRVFADNSGPSWCVYELKFTEPRILGKLLSHTIAAKSR